MLVWSEVSDEPAIFTRMCKKTSSIFCIELLGIFEVRLVASLQRDTCVPLV